MILRSIAFENWKQIYGEQKIAFSSDRDRNTTLFLGYNGAGKTTILNAVLWCFYEMFTPNISDPEEIVNKEAQRRGIKQGAVTIEFEYESAIYCARRESLGGKKSILSVTKKQTGSWVSVDNPERLLSSVLPRSLAPYFFYDGEAEISKFLEKSKEAGKAVRSIIGVSHVDKAISSLSKIRKKFGKEAELVGGQTAELSQLNAKIQDNEDIRAKLTLEIEEFKENELKLREVKTKIDEQLVSLKETEGIQRIVLNLEKQISEFESQLERAKRELFEYFGARGAFVLARFFVEKPRKIIDEAYESGKVPRDISEALFRDISKKEMCICGRPLGHGSTEFEKVLSRRNESGDTHEGRRLQYIGELVASIHEGCEVETEKFFELISSVRVFEEKIQALHDQKDDEAKKLTDNVGREHAQIVAEKKRVEDDLRSTVAKIGAGQRDLEVLTEQIREADKRKAELARVQGKVNDRLRFEQYTAEVQAYLEKWIEAHENLQRKAIEDRMNQALNEIANKAFVVRVDEEFGFGIFKKVGDKFEATDGSRGEKQLVCLLFVAALIETVTGRADAPTGMGLLLKGAIAPIILDSTFGSMQSDYSHRSLKRLSERTHQLVLFFSDQQIDSDLFSAIKKKVSQVYSLVIEAPDRANKEFEAAGFSFVGVRSNSSISEAITKIERLNYE